MLKQMIKLMTVAMVITLSTAVCYAATAPFPNLAPKELVVKGLFQRSYELY